MASPYKTKSIYIPSSGFHLLGQVPAGEEWAVSNIIICCTYDSYPFNVSPDDVVNVIIKNGDINNPTVQASEYIISNYPISKGETLIIDLGVRLVGNDHIYVSAPPTQNVGGFDELTYIHLTYTEV